METCIKECTAFLHWGAGGQFSQAEFLVPCLLQHGADPARAEHVPKPRDERQKPESLSTLQDRSLWAELGASLDGSCPVPGASGVDQVGLHPTWGSAGPGQQRWALGGGRAVRLPRARRRAVQSRQTQARPNLVLV